MNEDERNKIIMNIIKEAVKLNSEGKDKLVAFLVGALFGCISKLTFKVEFHKEIFKKIRSIKEESKHG